MAEALYARRKNVVRRCVYKTVFLINIQENYLNDICNFYELNETGNFIWEQLSDIKSKEELAYTLIKACKEDTDFNTVYDDVSEFINLLLALDFIKEIA